MKRYFDLEHNLNRKCNIILKRKLFVSENWNFIHYRYPFEVYTDSKQIIKRLTDFCFVESVEFLYSDYDEKKEEFFIDTKKTFKFGIYGYYSSLKLVEYNRIFSKFVKELRPLCFRSSKK